jgi:hypothetical protein
VVVTSVDTVGTQPRGTMFDHYDHQGTAAAIGWRVRHLQRRRHAIGMDLPEIAF